MRRGADPEIANHAGITAMQALASFQWKIHADYAAGAELRESIKQRCGPRAAAPALRRTARLVKQDARPCRVPLMRVAR